MMRILRFSFAAILLITGLNFTAVAANAIPLRDTTFNPVGTDHPIFAFQNIVFKRRLDSLRKTVSLDYNEHVQNYIDIYLNRKEHIGSVLGLSRYYFPIFEKALHDAGLPEELKFVTVIESALNPHAVSRSGAVGPWQFMFITARGYGLTMDSYIDERKDPVKASDAAARYFIDAYKRIGDWLLTIAAFNCGTGAVTRAIERSGGIADFWRVRPFLPKETQNYVPAFIATIYAMNYAQNHGIEARPPAFNTFTDVIPVTRTISISTIAKAAGLGTGDLLILNPAYKKQIVNGTPDHPKPLVIPAVANYAYSGLYEVLNGEIRDTPAMYASVTAESKETAGIKYHKVKPGQNLSKIAAIYAVEVQDIRAWNKLKSGSIVPGQSLKVSAPAGSFNGPKEASYQNYVVKAGDTLSGIAEKFKGATVAGIKSLNGLTRSAISPGMLLKISIL